MKISSLFLIFFISFQIKNKIAEEIPKAPFSNGKLSLKSSNQINYNQERRLSSALSRDEMDLIYKNQSSSSNQKILIADMKNTEKVNEIKSDLHQIAVDMESINDSMFSKLKIFEGIVERIKMKRRLKRKLYKLPSPL